MPSWWLFPETDWPRLGDPVTDSNSELPVELDLAPLPSGGATSPSLTRNSASRFFADAAGLVFGILSGVVTARGLGPSGKGLFSSLTLLSSIALCIFSMGLGDAAIVLVGQKRATVQDALSATISAVLGLSVVAMGALWGAALLAFGNDWQQVRTAAVLASLGLPLSILSYDLGYLLSAQERVSAHSAVVATTSIVTSLGLVIFVGVMPFSIAGGVMANIAGSSSGMVLAWWLGRRTRLSFRPRFNRTYLVPAVRYGISLALSYVVTVMLLRVDVLLTYALDGPDSAGQYSVSIALAALVGLLPLAISAGTFPRLAKLDDAHAKELTAQVCRYGVAAALTVALTLLVVVPVAVPVLFGREFRPAVLPTLILLPGSILWSVQWILCRAAAARGWPGLLLRSFLLGLVVMCGMDLFLIPLAGTTGAALSAVAGPGAGLLLCLFSYHRSPVWSLPLRTLVPRYPDFKGFVSQSLQLLPFLPFPSRRPKASER